MNTNMNTITTTITITNMKIPQKNNAHEFMPSGMKQSNAESREGAKQQ